MRCFAWWLLRWILGTSPGHSLYHVLLYHGFDGSHVYVFFLAGWLMTAEPLR